MHNPESVLENETHKFLWHFLDTNGLPNLGQTTGPYNHQQRKEKKNLQYCKHCCPGWPQGEVERKRKEGYQDLARELKTPWNIKVTVISIVIGALGTVSKGLVKRVEDLEIKGQVGIIQTTASLSSTRILRRVLENWGDLLSLKLQWKTIN